jgi:hypothetical protein
MHRRFARCGRMPAFPLFPPVAGLPAGTARGTMNPVVPGAPFGFLRWSAAVAKGAWAAGGPDVGRMFYGNRLSRRSLVSPRHEGHPRFRRGAASFTSTWFRRFPGRPWRRNPPIQGPRGKLRCRAFHPLIPRRRPVPGGKVGHFAAGTTVQTKGAAPWVRGSPLRSTVEEACENT